MTILGIDPGIGRTGWGTIIIDNGQLKIDNCGCVETLAGELVEKRLQRLYRELVLIIETSKPDALATEELFFNTNAKTALIVGQARGVILLAAAEKSLPVAVYTPLQVKVALTGYGRADKKQIGQMVKTILKLPSVPKPDDTADALAIALTHAFSRKMGIYKL